MIALLLVILLAIAILAFYVVIRVRYQHFARQGIPAPRASFPFGNTASSVLRKRNVVYDVDDVYR